MIKNLTIKTKSQGLHEITRQIEQSLNETAVCEGLMTVFIRHTSASLIIQENADPSAKRDLENWLNKLVPENNPLFSHTLEGADDMPAHVKAALTNTSLAIPIHNSQLCLGTWQGIYLWEHRRESHMRSVVLHIAGDKS